MPSIARNGNFDVNFRVNQLTITKLANFVFFLLFVGRCRKTLQKCALRQRGKKDCKVFWRSFLWVRSTNDLKQLVISKVLQVDDRICTHWSYTTYLVSFAIVNTLSLDWVASISLFVFDKKEISNQFSKIVILSPPAEVTRENFLVANLMAKLEKSAETLSLSRCL